MIKTDFYKTRKDGVKLYRTYSEAIDVENSGFIYTETDIPIEGDTDELTVDDTLAMLNELGVDVNDQS